MPDIDMDFDSRYRDEMIRYAAERYGRDHVAQIVTFSTIKARAAVRDAARCSAHPYAVGDRIAKAMPPLVMGRDTPLWACLEKHEARGRVQEGRRAAADVRDRPRRQEGHRRGHRASRACAARTASTPRPWSSPDKPLTEYLPVQRKPEPGQDPRPRRSSPSTRCTGSRSSACSRWTSSGCATSTSSTDALDLIRETGVDVDIDAIPLDDDRPLAMLRKGDSIGVFQLEGGPMRSLMRSLAPTSFDDVAALVALYRPGPMAANMHHDYADRKNGRQPVSYPPLTSRSSWPTPTG